MNQKMRRAALSRRHRPSVTPEASYDNKSKYVAFPLEPKTKHAASPRRHRRAPTPESSDDDDDSSSTSSSSSSDRFGFFELYRTMWLFITGRHDLGIINMDLDASFLNTIAIVVGILFFNSCPAEPFLPVFLIVYGAGGLTLQVWALIYALGQVSSRSIDDLLTENENPYRSANGFFFSLLCLFLVGWYFTGCYRVFSMPMNVQCAALPNNNCAFPAYVLALWVVTWPLVKIVGHILVVTGFVARLLYSTR